MSDRPFVEVPLTSIVEDGILFTANEVFFWPLGLALTVIFDPDTGEYSNLHVRQWEPAEVINDDPADPTYTKRKEAFRRWNRERQETLLR